jgi:thiamine pyrophosphokinase
MSHTHTLVVGAAPVPGQDAFYRDLLRDADHVVAADAGGEWCVALGRTPDVVVGDFDSSSAGASGRLAALGAVVREYRPAKDATDLDLAVAAARGAYPDPLLVTAAFTRRIDHTLAAFGTLADAGPGAAAVDPGWSGRVCRTSQPVTSTLEAGTLFSVVALRAGTRLTIDGALWELRDAPVGLLSGLGVSNRATGGPVRITVTEGIALVIVWSEGARGLLY